MTDTASTRQPLPQPPAEPPEGAPARLPPLSSTERTLLHNFIACNEDPIALATHCKLEYLDIIEFTSRPDIARWINHIRMLRARNLRDAALAELERCLKTSRDPVERRRAATTILRATDPARAHPPRNSASHGRVLATLVSSGEDPQQAPASCHDQTVDSIAGTSSRITHPPTDVEQMEDPDDDDFDDIDDDDDCDDDLSLGKSPGAGLHRDERPETATGSETQSIPATPIGGADDTAPAASPRDAPD